MPMVAEDMMEELGLDRHAPYDLKAADLNQFNYASLQNPPSSHKTANSEWAASIYRGIVPARNILRRDFAVNGAMVRTLLACLPNARVISSHVSRLRQITVIHSR